MELSEEAVALEEEMKAPEHGKSVGVLEEIRDALGRIELILKEKNSVTWTTKTL